MKQYVTRRIAYGLFVTILVIFFLWKFGHPAVKKFISNEVFLKISTEPKDRTKVVDIPLPAVTFCPSNRSSALSQVIFPTNHHTNMDKLPRTNPNIPNISNCQTYQTSQSVFCEMSAHI